VRAWFFFLAGLAVMLAPPQAAARPESPALERLREVEKLLAGQRSVSGRFTLEKRSDHLAEPMRGEGRFFFARPDFLIWEQSAPNWSRLELAEGRIEVWSGSPEAPVRSPGAEAAGQAARALLGWMDFEPQAIAAGYEVILERPEPLTITAWPRRPGARKYLESIQIEFAFERPVVRRVVLNERNSRTLLVFDQVVLNQPRPEPGHGRLDN
jgi:hypothetical protein